MNPVFSTESQTVRTYLAKAKNLSGFAPRKPPNESAEVRALPGFAVFYSNCLIKLTVSFIREFIETDKPDKALTPADSFGGFRGTNPLIFFGETKNV